MHDDLLAKSAVFHTGSQAIDSGITCVSSKITTVQTVDQIVLVLD